MVGKTTLLHDLNAPIVFDLFDPELEQKYRAHPRLFWEQVSVLARGSVYVVDEIQRVPALLDYVQMSIDQFGHLPVLSGSSARKLRRSKANLLGGRALDLRLHPLTADEMENHFSIDKAMTFGTLPHIAAQWAEGKNDVAQQLRSYVTTYIKEEIQAEALTRNLGGFQRFVAIAAQANSQRIEYQNISRDCAVPASTVKEYFSILEDTLLGRFLWPLDRNEHRKARPKFYFFDCGVVRALQDRIIDPPTPPERGFLFEQWMINELRHINDYRGWGHDFCYWGRNGHEVDIVVTSGGNPIMAFECKTGDIGNAAASISEFNSRFPSVPVFVASLRDDLPRSSGILNILPWRQAVEKYKNSVNHF